MSTSGDTSVNDARRTGTNTSTEIVTTPTGRTGTTTHGKQLGVNYIIKY